MRRKFKEETSFALISSFSKASSFCRQPVRSLPEWRLREQHDVRMHGVPAWHQSEPGQERLPSVRARDLCDAGPEPVRKRLHFQIPGPTLSVPV